MLVKPKLGIRGINENLQPETIPLWVGDSVDTAVDVPPVVMVVSLVVVAVPCVDVTPVVVVTVF